MLLLYSCFCLVRMHFIMFLYVCVCVYDLYLTCVCACLFSLFFFLCNIVLYCVLYYIMRPYTEGCLDRYHIGIPRELYEIRTQPWLSEGSLTCDPCHHRDPSFNCTPKQFHHQCPWFHIMNDMSATCEPRTINLSITGESITCTT